AAASASGTVLGTCLRSFGLSWASQSKLRTSAAILTGELETSKRSILRTPLSPAVNAAQNFSRPMPSGVTQPMPVITTRRGSVNCLNMRLDPDGYVVGLGVRIPCSLVRSELAGVTAVGNYVRIEQGLGCALGCAPGRTRGSAPTPLLTFTFTRHSS